LLDAIHAALAPLRDVFLEDEDPRIASAIGELLALRDAIVLGEAVAIATDEGSMGV
jgi:hypothetical protein